MWICSECGEELAERTASCWKCGTNRADSKAMEAVGPATNKGSQSVSVIALENRERTAKASRPKSNPMSVVAIILIILVAGCLLITALIIIQALF